MIVFSVVDPNSFENALKKWHPELNANEYEKVPKIIVGNKTDMRDPNNPSHIKTQAVNTFYKG